MAWRVSLALVFAVIAAIASARDITLTTARGSKVMIDIQTPKEGGKRPVLVVAPGAGYRKEFPLIASLLKEAAFRGYVAVAFNWGYMAKGETQPSADRSVEMDDLKSVLAYIREREDVDPTRIILAGKSFGSMIAYRAFQADGSLQAILLLTPIIPERGSESVRYPDLSRESRPVLLVVGNNDPDNCPIPNLYEATRNLGTNVGVLVFPGNHGLEVGDEKTPEGKARNASNVQAVISAIGNYLANGIPR